MRLRITCLFNLLWLFVLPAARAQVYNRYHADLYSGLPSNRVYSMTVDNHGYLWLATDKGIAQYNGYSFKTYTTDDGLPSNDVWRVFQDKKGRLWPEMMGNRMGYILNNRYRDIHIISRPGIFYITDLINYAGGVMFSGGNPRYVYKERNDTLVAGQMLPAGTATLSSNRKIICVQGNATNILALDSYGNTTSRLSCPTYNSDSGWRSSFFDIDNQVCNYLRYTNELDVQDMISCSKRKIYFKTKDDRPDPISTIIYPRWQEANNGITHVITQHSIFELDRKMMIKSCTPLDLFIDTQKKAAERIVTYMTESSYWGKCFGTNATGFYCNYGINKFAKHIASADLSSSICINSPGIDTASYWWSLANRTLTVVSRKGEQNTRYPNAYETVRIVPYTKDTALIANKGMLYYYLYHNRKLIPFVTGYYWINGPEAHKWNPNTIPYARDIIVAGKDHFYLTGMWFYEAFIRHGILYAKLLDEGRYFHLLKDSGRNVYWGYYNDQMLLYNPVNKSRIKLDKMLKNLGIQDIEQVAIHRASGNIFIKDHSHLLLIDPLHGTITSLFKNYNLNGAMFYLKENLIVMAGKFGVLFSQIKTGNTSSEPVVYTNLKNSGYLQVQDMAVLQHDVVLKTDKCTYILDVPTDSALRYATPPPQTHKLMVIYRDSLYDVPLRYELNITNASDKLLFDLISPEGNGTVHYSYHFGDSDYQWHTLNDNELKLPSLQPGKHVQLYIRASDDVWIGNTIQMTLYMVPQWWQTPGWSLAIKSFIVVATLLFLLTIVLLTYYFVNRATLRKQLLTSLEYRSIHAQINPHFIFNTLNTALYFIKKERTAEAVAHVSRFSRLLRGYLEASQKRYISIANEITNLTSYIELQQTRFDGSFDYRITVGDNLQTELLYIPSLLLQPIVENAMNHGLAPRGPGGHLHVIFQHNNNGSGITCIIDDNGIGRAAAKEINRNSIPEKQSHGSRLTKELVDVFNRYEKMGIEIVYIDKNQPETGTCVIITISHPRYEP